MSNTSPVYKRILLKLSGEALAKDCGKGEILNYDFIGKVDHRYRFDNLDEKIANYIFLNSVLSYSHSYDCLVHFIYFLFNLIAQSFEDTVAEIVLHAVM